MKNISILGSTGSIGVNTLSVISQHHEMFNVYALSGNKNTNLLFKQCLEFQPKYVVVIDDFLSRELAEKLKRSASKTIVLTGEKELDNIASMAGVDLVMAAIVGIAGLKSTFAAVSAGKKVLLANKESLVVSGKILMDKAHESGSTIIPVDSEHNAIFQCLFSDNKKYTSEMVDQIILTASGGGFLNRNLHELEDVTPKEACDHPNWSMGQKISIDSSTMVNKALEMIEAFWLFDVPVDKLKVIIHPQSIIHSMVKYNDGSYISQMGSPDMKIPITHALFYPKRGKLENNSLDLTCKALTFYNVDYNRFQVIEIVYSILEKRDWVACIILNAANEILVELFLSGKIKYLDIISQLYDAVQILKYSEAETIDDVIKIDRHVRKYIREKLT